MTSCPKCGFQNRQPQAASCPKCGVYYSKFRKASEQQKAESKINEELSAAMSFSDSYPDNLSLDVERHKDKDSYTGIVFLSWFFIAISGLLLVFWIFDMKFIWSLMTYYSDFIRKEDKFFFMIFFGSMASLPIAVYFAIGGALKLGKDIADNTRATRNYLERIAKKK